LAWPMQKLRLYDPSRVPRDWTDLIRPGQFAAFLSDVETSAPVEENGRAISSASQQYCILFPSLPEAESYCRDAVHHIPRIKCEVFDSEGRKNAAVAVFVSPQFEYKVDSERKARRLIRWGIISLTAAVPFVGYSWWMGASVVWWPILVAINLFFFGLRLMHWGNGLRDELRYRKQEAQKRMRSIPPFLTTGQPDPSGQTQMDNRLVSQKDDRDKPHAGEKRA
jgi:hypothetical protein